MAVSHCNSEYCQCYGSIRLYTNFQGLGSSLADDIYRQVELFFKILFDSDQVEQILILEQHHDIDITVFLESGFESDFLGNAC